MNAMLLLLLLPIQQGAEEGEYYQGKWPADVPKTTPVEYYLPWAAGKQFAVMPDSHGALQNKHAIDFAMPMRTPILASADGIVIKIVESGPNTGGRSNDLIIQHADGNVTCYLHLANKGVKPRLGEFVHRGDVVAYSGASGTGVPHLHFSLNKLKMLECIPVTFKEKNWVSQNQSFEAQFSRQLKKYREAETGLVWGRRFRFWSRALDARKKFQSLKPSGPDRLRRIHSRLEKQFETLDEEIAAFAEKAKSDPSLYTIAIRQLKGTKHEKSLKALKLKSDRKLQSRRSALERVFAKDMKGADPRRDYEKWLKRYKDAPEAEIVRQRLASL